MKSLALSTLAFCLSTAAYAGELRVSDAYIPMAPPEAMAHAAYMTISNEGTIARKLTSVTAENYHMAHLHMTVEKDGISSMASLSHISLLPGQEIVLMPGKMHVMLMKPKMALKEKSKIYLTLNFANGEALTVEAIVKSGNDVDHGHHGHDKHHEHDAHHGHDDHADH